MASHRITLDTDTISMTAAAADSLISRGQGDPALLYLYLLRHQGYLDPDQSAKELGWSRLQLDSALTHLRELGLAGGVPQPQFNEAVPKREQAPAYSADDLNQELKDQTSAFPDLLSEVEVAMGKRLSPSDARGDLSAGHLADPRAPGQIRPGAQASDVRHPHRSLSLEGIRRGHIGSGRGISEKTGILSLSGRRSAGRRGDHRP